MRELTAAWLGARWGVDSVRINTLRRAGELLAHRPTGTHEWRYPAWQFDSTGALRPEVRRLLAAARERRIGPERLTALLHQRSGMTHGRTLLDALLGGDVERVIAAAT